jgi:hypothetical protein
VQRGRGEEEEEEEEDEETDGFKNAGTVRHRHAHKKGTQDCMHTLVLLLYERTLLEYAYYAMVVATW